jgi:hypothetical protein
MRLAAIVCALVIVMCVAVFGGILSQRLSNPAGSASPAPTAPAHEAVRAVVATVEEQNTPLAETTGLKSYVTPNARTVLTLGSSEAASPRTVPAATSVPMQAAIPPAAATSFCAGNPNALGISRVVEIDTTGGPGFGFEHFKAYDFLREGEVVLTFDDGPWPKNTPAVLAALAVHCDLLPHWPARHLRAPNPQAGGGGRTCDRFAYLVSSGSVQDQGNLPRQWQARLVRIRPQGRDREGDQRRALGGRRADRALFPLPCTAAATRADRLSRQAQYRHLFRRH